MSLWVLELVESGGKPSSRPENHTSSPQVLCAIVTFFCIGPALIIVGIIFLVRVPCDETELKKDATSLPNTAAPSR